MSNEDEIDAWLAFLQSGFQDYYMEEESWDMNPMQDVRTWLPRGIEEILKRRGQNVTGTQNLRDYLVQTQDTEEAMEVLDREYPRVLEKRLMRADQREFAEYNRRYEEWQAKVQEWHKWQAEAEARAAEEAWEAFKLRRTKVSFITAMLAANGYLAYQYWLSGQTPPMPMVPTEPWGSWAVVNPDKPIVPQVPMARRGDFVGIPNPENDFWRIPRRNY